MDSLDFLHNYYLTDTEQNLYQSSLASNTNYISASYNNNICESIISKLPQAKILKDYHLSFDSCATNIIQQLFDKYVDDDTLILTTEIEHFKVNEILSNYKNVLKIIKPNLVNFDLIGNFKEDIDLSVIISNYKKVFVFCVGVHSNTGIVNHQNLFIRLKQLFNSLNKESVFVLDAVQEMFMLPRDYSLFDYVIGTAHVLFPNFNLGICLSKDNDFRNYLINAEYFNTLLTILDKHKDIFANYSYILTDNFQYLQNYGIKLHNHLPYIFAIETDDEALVDYVKHHNKDKSKHIIRFRAMEYLFTKDQQELMFTKLNNYFELME